jgi:acyl-CoA dehydrogenase
MVYEQGQACEAEGNSDKFLATEGCNHACENAILTHGGMGYAKK